MESSGDFLKSELWRNSWKTNTEEIPEGIFDGSSWIIWWGIFKEISDGITVDVSEGISGESSETIFGVMPKEIYGGQILDEIFEAITYGISAFLKILGEISKEISGGFSE